MVIGAGDPSILLERQNVKSLGHERQIDLHVHLVRSAAEFGRNLSGRRQRQPELEAGPRDDHAENGAPLFDRSTSETRLMPRAPSAAPRRQTLERRRLKRSSQIRGRGRSISTWSRMRPFDSTTTRLARKTASATSWVMKTTVGRRSCQIRVEFLLQRHRVCASTLAKGSSISSTAGLLASARTTPTRCCMPPDSSLG